MKENKCFKDVMSIKSCMRNIGCIKEVSRKCCNLKHIWMIEGKSEKCPTHVHHVPKNGIKLVPETVSNLHTYSQINLSESHFNQSNLIR